MLWENWFKIDLFKKICLMLYEAESYLINYYLFEIPINLKPNWISHKNHVLLYQTWNMSLYHLEVVFIYKKTQLKFKQMINVYTSFKLVTKLTKSPHYSQNVYTFSHIQTPDLYQNDIYSNCWFFCSKKKNSIICNNFKKLQHIVYNNISVSLVSVSVANACRFDKVFKVSFNTLIIQLDSFFSHISDLATIS